VLFEKGLPFEDHPSFLKVATICPLANAPKVTSTNKTRKNPKQNQNQGKGNIILLFSFIF
jgi:hypothetical protein